MADYTPETYFVNPAHASIARSRYFLKDDTGAVVENDIFEVFKRVNDYVFQNDPDNLEAIQSLCESKRFMYAGRPLAQAGTGIDNLFNCFVLGIGDTREEISECRRIHFHIQAHGGGTGINFSKLRPSGAWCKGANARASGPEGFITSMSYDSSNIQQGGNRSGANMGILEDWHPGLLNFITKKSRGNWENIRKFAVVTNENMFKQWQWRTPHAWQTFNVSVGLSDDFMRQVKRQSTKPWHLKWDDQVWKLWDYEATLHDYSPNGDQIDEQVQITVVAPDEDIAWHEATNKIPFRNASSVGLFLKKGPYELSADEWFEKICANSWEDGCPGIFFIDRAREYHNGEYFNKLDATNPCAEQILPPWSVCCLSSLVLPEFVNEDGSIMWEDLGDAVRLGIRALNHITLLNKTDIDKIDDNTQRERRIGLGTIGMHEMLIQVALATGDDLRYSNELGRKFAKKVLKFIKHAAYEASIEMAKEIGPFPEFKYKEFVKSKFVQRLLKERPDFDDALRTHGIANVTILTQAPTGTTGTITGYSSGCEPYFAMAYQRNSNIGTIIDGCPSFVNWLTTKSIDFAEHVYSLKELRRHKRVPRVFEEAQDISWHDHLRMQAVFAEQVDSSVSKTINLASTAKIKDIRDAYIEAYDLGIKSTTVYRDGSKIQVLENMQGAIRQDESLRPKTIITMPAPKRPDNLDCDIHTVSVKGERWKVLAGLLHGRPYEVFCFPEDQIEIPPSKTEGILVRNGGGRYRLELSYGDDHLVIKNVASLLLTDEHRMVTRLLSTSLRHGAPLATIVSQLAKCDGEVTTFSKALLRVLRKYVTDAEYLATSACQECGSKDLVLQEGCLKCRECGYSGCG